MSETNGLRWKWRPVGGHTLEAAKDWEGDAWRLLVEPQAAGEPAGRWLARVYRNGELVHLAVGIDDGEDARWAAMRAATKAGGPW